MATVQLSVTATADQLEKISNYLGYQTEIDGEANPQTRKEFVWEKTLEYWKNCYRAEKAKSAETARQAALDEAETETATLQISE